MRFDHSSQRVMSNDQFFYTFHHVCDSQFFGHQSPTPHLSEELGAHINDCATSWSSHSSVSADSLFNHVARRLAKSRPDSSQRVE
jgi:hypothetical protein